MSAKVRDVMTARVVAVREDATFKEMADILGACRISAFPVIDHAGQVIGVVSEADLLVRLAGQDEHAAWLDAIGRAGQATGAVSEADLLARQARQDDLMHPGEHDKTAAAVVASALMTSPPVTVGPDEPVQRAARLMFDRRVKRLPVVNDAGRLVGIISRADVLSVFRRADEEIRCEAADQVILGRFLMHPDSMTVTVRDGILTISGRPENDDAGREIVAALRHLEGVVAVRDRLSYAGSAWAGR
jgi:CBS-domain-containing membrane protein